MIEQIWFVISLYGLVVSVSGPIDSNEKCITSLNSFRTIISEEWKKGNAPVIDGKIVTPFDVKSACVFSAVKPRTTFE